jgi:hypothetical protein
MQGSPPESRVNSSHLKSINRLFMTCCSVFILGSHNNRLDLVSLYREHSTKDKASPLSTARIDSQLICIDQDSVCLGGVGRSVVFWEDFFHLLKWPFR